MGDHGAAPRTTGVLRGAHDEVPGQTRHEQSEQECAGGGKALVAGRGHTERGDVGSLNGFPGSSNRPLGNRQLPQPLALLPSPEPQLHALDAAAEPRMEPADERAEQLALFPGAAAHLRDEVGGGGRHSRVM